MSNGDGGVAFSRFSVGLRFSHAGLNDASPDALWNILFAAYAPQDMAGARLFFFENSRDRFDREACSTLVFSHHSLKKSQLLYQKLLLNERARSFLTLQRPVVQGNYLEKLARYTYLGETLPDGTVAGGEATYGAMRFSGRVFPPIPPILRVRFLLVCDAAFGLSPHVVYKQLLRTLAQAYPFAHFIPVLVTSGGCGSTEALLFDCDGKYISCAGEYEDDAPQSYFGLLPLGHAGVVEADDTVERMHMLKAALARGCRTVYCAHVSAEEERAMRFAVPAEPGARLVFLDSARMLALSRFERLYRDATAVLLCLPEQPLYETLAAAMKRPLVKSFRLNTELDFDSASAQLLEELRAAIC